MIEALSRAHTDDWLRLRKQLWPQCSDTEHRAEMGLLLSQPSRFAQFIAYTENRVPNGFVEASIRNDYVNGTTSSPVAFLEGLFVAPDARRTGVARSLVAVVTAWAGERGITELASDAELSNTLSHTVHAALGFEETERVVFFRRRLADGDDTQ